MASVAPLQRVRVGWWAAPEAGSALHALRGSLLRAELAARWPGFSPVLVGPPGPAWAGPGFTGLPWAAHDGSGLPVGLDVLVRSGAPDGDGPALAAALGEGGTAMVNAAPEAGWGLEPEHTNIGPPFAVPEPILLAARHLGASTLEARGAYLRVAEGLPRNYVLVEGALLDGSLAPHGEPGPAGGGEASDDGAGGRPRAVYGRSDLERALARLVARSPGAARAEVVALEDGPWVADDAAAARVLRHRRAEAEEARHLNEDWPGDPHRPRLSLRPASPTDLAAAVAGAGAVVARSGALMALAWSLGVPHVALADEGSPASDSAAWTGDASALVGTPADLQAAIDNVFARRGRPPGLKRLEATLDQSLDQAAADLAEAADKMSAYERDPGATSAVAQARLEELEAVNGALRQRLAAERLRFGERAALLEKAADTSVESAIKAVRGQDVIVRRRLEQVEREMKRLQEETAVQQAELRSIYATRTMRALTPVRQYYVKLKKAAR